MSCLTNEGIRQALTELIVSNLNEMSKAGPIQLSSYLKKVYDFVKDASGKEDTALAAAAMTPAIVRRVLVLSPALAKQVKEKSGYTLEDEATALSRKYETKESIDELRADLGLTQSPVSLFAAAEQFLETAPVAEPVLQVEGEEKEEIMLYKPLMGGAFMTFGSEFLNQNTYTELNTKETINYEALRQVLSDLKSQDKTSSSQLDEPVFLKIMAHKDTMSKAGFNFPNISPDEISAVLVDAKGAPIRIRGKIAWFRLYDSPSFKETANGEKVIDLNPSLYKGRRAGLLTQLKVKLKDLITLNRSAGMSEAVAEKAALKDLTTSFNDLNSLREYIKAGNTVTASITGGEGFVPQNQYKSTPLKELILTDFVPQQVKTEQIDVNYPEGTPYFTYPGVSNKLVIKQPALVERQDILTDLIKLFTEPLYKKNADGTLEELAFESRINYIKNYILVESGVSFVYNQKNKSFKHSPNTYQISINGVPENINFNDKASVKKNADRLLAYFSQGMPNPNPQVVYNSDQEFNDASIKYGVKSASSLNQPLIDSQYVLKGADGKYYKINMPHLSVIGSNIGKTFDKPTLTNEGDKLVVSTETKSYDDFIIQQFETNAVMQEDKTIRPINPVFNYSPSLEEYNKFTETAAGAAAVAENKVAEEAAKENVVPQAPATTILTEPGPADKSLDDILGEFTIDKKLTQKLSNAKVLEDHINAAKEWYDNSPLKAYFPFNTVFSAVNTSNGPVARWSINGIILFHYYNQDGTIDKKRSGDFTDLYHEAWHGFTQTFLTKEDRVKLYAETRKRTGSFQDFNGKYVTFEEANAEQLEEFLAEEFREYMISGGKKVIKGTPVRNTVFRKIMNFLKALFNKSKTEDVIADPMSNDMVFQMYEKLRIGDLSSYTFDKNNAEAGSIDKGLTARNQNSVQPELSLSEANTLVNSINSIISSFSDHLRKRAMNPDEYHLTRLMSTEKNRKSVFKHVLRTFGEKKEALKAELDAIPTEHNVENDTKRNRLTQSLKLIQWAIDEFGDVDDLSKNKSGGGLLNYYSDKTNFLSDEDKKRLFDKTEDDNEEDDQFNLDNAEVKADIYDRSGNEVSQYENSKPEVKYLLASIHKFDKAGKPVRNILGIQELTESHIVWNKIARILNGVMERPAMYEALHKAAYQSTPTGNIVIDPILAQVLEKLGPTNAKTAAEMDLWQKFWATFNMMEIPLIQVTVKGTSEILDQPDYLTYSMTIGRANSADSRTIYNWDNKFKTISTDYIILDSIGATPNTLNRRYLDLDKIIADFADPVTNRLKADKVFDFLTAVGINLSDKKAIREAVENKNVGRASVLFARIKTLANDHKINRIYDFKELFKEFPKKGDAKALSSDMTNLNALAELENRNSDTTSNYAVTNAENNTQYEQSLHNSMSIMISTINGVEDIWEHPSRADKGLLVKSAYKALIEMPHMAHLDITKNPQAASSIWLNSIFHIRDVEGNLLSPEDKKFGRKREKDGVPVKFNLSNLSGVQMVTENSSDGIASASADEFTKLIMDFHLSHSGMPEMMRHADKGTSFSIWLENIIGGAKNEKSYVDTTSFFPDSNNKIQAYESGSPLTKIMGNYLNAEMQRINKLTKLYSKIEAGEKVNYDINYIKEGSKFVVFESILDNETKLALYQYGSYNEIDNAELKRSVDAQIANYFANQFAAVKTKFAKSKFIDPALRSKTIANAAGYNTSEQNVTDALLNSFVVNSFIHNIEQMNIIYGDIAQYNMKKEEFHKRNAGAGSTGNLLTTDAEMISYVNNKGRKWAARKGIAEKKLSQHGEVDTAVLEDNEIPSAYYEQIKDAIEDSIRTKYKARLKNAEKDPAKTAIIEKEIQEKILSTVEAYGVDSKGNGKMTEGDGQGWITFDFYRAASIMEGSWTSKQETMYNAICAGEKISHADSIEFFPTKKYQYWGPIATKGDELPLMAFHKFSLFPLIPTVVEGTNLEKLHNKMMNQNIDYALFQSGSKISTITPISKDGKKEANKFYNKERDFDTEGTLTPNTIFAQFLKNQLEIASHFKEKVTFPTQMRKLIENGLMEAGVPTDFRTDLESLGEREQEWKKLFKGKDDSAAKKASPHYALIKKYEGDIAALTNLKKEALIKEAGIKYKIQADGSKTIVIDRKVLEFLQGELSRQDLAEHEISFIKSTKGGEGLAHDLSLSLSSEKLEKILNALVVKRLVKQKFKGEGLIQVAGSGFENNLRGELTAAEKLKYGTNELPFYSRNYYVDKNGVKRYTETKAMKVKIALQGDFVKLLKLTHPDGKAIGTRERLNELLKNEEWLNIGDHRKMISITGPRIPTQENNSMEFGEVYEFLPSEAGNIVILPSEIVAKSGGDFDIDKITFMMPNIKSKIDASKIDPAVKPIWDKKKAKKPLTDEEKVILDEIYKNTPQVVTLPLDADTEEGLENRILNDMREILQLKDNYVSLVRPNGTDLVKPIADDLSDKLGSYNARTVTYDGNKKRIPGTRVFEIEYNLYKHASNNIGKQTLGLGAVDNTYNTVYNRIGLRLNKTDKDGKEIKLRLPHNTLKNENGEDVVSLSHLNDVTGETSISSIIAQLINGWVDIAKDAWVFNLQANKEISPTLLFMIQAGIPLKQAIYMVSHPLIREYVEEQKLAKSTFAGPLGKGDKNPLFYRNAARKVMLNKLFGEKTVNDLKGKEGAASTINAHQQVYGLFDLVNVQEAFSHEEDDKGVMHVEKELYKRISSKEAPDVVDKAIFMHFIELEELGKANTKLKMNTNFDTGRSNTLFDAQKKIRTLNELREEAIFPDGTVDSILNETPIGSFYIQEFQLNLWQGLFELRNSNEVNEFLLAKMKDFNKFSKSVKDTFGDSEKLVNEFRNDLPSFIFQNSLRRPSIDGDTYKGLDLKDLKTIKKLTTLKHAVFVKDGTIYIDKPQLVKDYDSLDATNGQYELTLADGTVVTVAPVKKTDFTTADNYYAFVMEREIFRDKYKGAEGWARLKERADVKLRLADLSQGLPRTENETDAHFNARVNTIAYEETLRNLALDATFNAAKIFSSQTSMADQLVQIQVLYPDMMNDYSILRALVADINEKGPLRKANIMINDNLKGDDTINIFHQNLLELSDPGKIKLDNVSAIERERVADFFKRLTTYAFLQSGMNTKGKFSLVRLVPQENFTELMTSYMGAFLPNINNITLQRYWQQFIIVNSNKKARARMRDYTIAKYNPATDYVKSDMGMATVEEAEKFLLDKDQAEVNTKQSQIKYSKDSSGNLLFDVSQNMGRSTGLSVTQTNPTITFVVNGVAAGVPVGDGLTGEASLLTNTPTNVVMIPTKKSFSKGDAANMTKADLMPDGTPYVYSTPVIPAKTPVTKPFITVETLMNKGSFRKKPVLFVESIPTTKTVPIAARNDGVTIKLVESLMRQKFIQQAWTKPAIQKDGSQAKALIANEFKTFEEFLTFALIHEVLHDTIKKQVNETIGAYEDRINNAALTNLRANYVAAPVKTQSALDSPIEMMKRIGKSNFDKIIHKFKNDNGELLHLVPNLKGLTKEDWAEGNVNYEDLTYDTLRSTLKELKRLDLSEDAELIWNFDTDAIISVNQFMASLKDEIQNIDPTIYDSSQASLFEKGEIVKLESTDTEDDSKTLNPVPASTINPELKKQIDSVILSLLDQKNAGQTLSFPKAGFGQWMVGADENAVLKDGKIKPIAPSTFVYLSEQLWDNFKFVNPNFAEALGFMKQPNLMQMNAEVSDDDVLEALSFCFK